jgi:hypothetical protein
VAEVGATRQIHVRQCGRTVGRADVSATRIAADTGSFIGTSMTKKTPALV